MPCMKVGVGFIICYSDKGFIQEFVIMNALGVYNAVGVYNFLKFAFNR